MNDVVIESVADLGDIFAGSALVSHDTISALLSQYRVLRDQIGQVHRLCTAELVPAFGYFVGGNCDKDRQIGVSSLFRLEGAVAALNSDFWNRAIYLTDVLDLMPQKRRAEWHDQIEKRTCPEFTEQTVRETLETLLAQRAQFMAERVDGVFKGLSGEHVTNRPEGFSKRMIIGYVLGSFGSMSYERAGLINDLRCVIARLMRRDEPKHNASNGLIDTLKSRWGEWVEIDGGALRIRLYRKGTAHLEVHPDMAWRLNTILAHLYPRAIPPEFRRRPARRVQGVQLIQQPLPFTVVAALASLEPAWQFATPNAEDYRRIYIKNAMAFKHCSVEPIAKHVREAAEQVLQAIGGVERPHGWQFDFPPEAVIRQIVASGLVPDERAHQFYPTSATLAKVAIQHAEIGPAHTCLEPQAGLGGLAAFMPQDRTVCVEVAPMRAEVLRAKGYETVCADFLEWSRSQLGRHFDRVVMNPPYDVGRWRAHLEAAASLVGHKGRLVAILPSGAAKMHGLLPGFACTFPERFERAFAGASLDTVLLVADRM